jgi:SAM-dependent methyltransferase
MYKKLEELIPGRARSAIRSVCYELADGRDFLLGRRDRLTPPRRLQVVIGGGDFKRAGQKFLRLFAELGGLRPDHRVLDVGCGVGRMAIPLTGFLSAQGSYDGFDVVPECVEWCQEKIASAYPNFHFLTADLFNEMYNPRGTCNARDFVFPYPSQSFDFVYLTSVFTHTLPEDTEHFVSEIARVLRTGGRCFATFFLLNADSEKLIKAGESSIDFAHAIEGCRLQDVEVPEHAVAYEEDHVRSLLAKHGLKLKEPIYFGRWCGRKEFTVYQDIVISEKESGAEC